MVKGFVLHVFAACQANAGWNVASVFNLILCLVFASGLTCAFPISFLGKGCWEGVLGLDIVFLIHKVMGIWLHIAF